MPSFQPQESAAAAPKPCAAAGCSFFGSAATYGMCSVCHKKHVSSTATATTPEPVAPPASVVVPKPAAPTTSVSFAPATRVAVSSSSSSKEAAAATKAQQPSRCPACYKKVGLTGFVCRCGKTFCGRHRHPEEHGCAFDFKGAGRDAIARANPLIRAEKMTLKI